MTAIYTVRVSAVSALIDSGEGLRSAVGLAKATGAFVMRDYFHVIPMLFHNRLRDSGGLSRSAAIALFVLTSAGVAQADVAQVGAGTALRCYDFKATNNQTNRKLTDIHFVFPGGWPSHVRTPASWDATLGPGGRLNFTTPPTAPPAASSPSHASPAN